ncbi:MAG: hypothetical protein R3C32_09805 [Chloroflexota bacterium]
MFAFALADSDLPLKVAWPILLGNVTTQAARARRVVGRAAPARRVVELPSPEARRKSA